MKKKVNNFTGKVPNWLALAELKVDYYSQFVKSWIPFNAWYMVSFHSDALSSDRKIIDHIKADHNPFRDRIISLLQGDDNDSTQFRNHLAQLHISLEGHPIPNHETKITFSSINIFRNSVTHFTHSFKKHSYKVDFNTTAPKTSKRLKCEIFITKGLKPVYVDDFNDWSMDDLLQSSKYQALSTELREQLRLCYEEINPLKPVNVVVKPKRRSNGNYSKPPRSIAIDTDSNIYFVEDVYLLSQVLIEVLYSLRCALFHGEIDPTETNQSTYKHAYHIQKTLIQELH